MYPRENVVYPRRPFILLEETSNMARKTEVAEKVEKEAADKPKAEVEQVELHNEAALALALASERVASARATLELRDTQFKTLLASVGTEYSEGGKYRVVELNVDKRSVGRVKVEDQA